MSQEDYVHQLLALQPPGAALPRDPEAVWPRILGALAEGHAAIERRAGDLIREADPRETLELLPDFEHMLGLPDDCSAAAETLQERRAAVEIKLKDIGRQDLPYYCELAESLGYEITINEPRPFIAGFSRCGDLLNGGHEVRFEWEVYVKGPRVTLFRAGESAPPDRLGSIRRATDLECRIRQNIQSHTEVFFFYEDEPGNILKGENP